MRFFSTFLGRGATATLAGITALAVAACTAPGPTGYRPLTGQFGHTVERVNESTGTWRVVYYANTETPRARVEDFTLYRAARLARDQGASHFAVMDEDFGREEERRSIRDAPPPGFERGGAGYGSDATISRTRNEAGFGRDPVSVRLRAELVIRPYETTPPPGAMRLYETEQTLNRLTPAVRSASP